MKHNILSKMKTLSIALAAVLAATMSPFTFSQKLKGAADQGGSFPWGNSSKKGTSSLSTDAPVTSSPTEAPVTSPPTMGSIDNEGGNQGNDECFNDAPTDTTNAVLIKFVENPYGGETGET